jgi:hypothetical protein
MLRYGCGCPQDGPVLLPFCRRHGQPLKGRGLADGLKLRGAYAAEIWEGQQLLRKIPFANTVMTAGLTHLLNTQFAAGSQVTAWYFGLIGNTSFSAISIADTMASHAGWTESTAYAEAARQAWSPSVASGVASNTTVAVFTPNASVTLRGAFITSVSTKGGATGTLWSAGQFDALQALASGQALRLTYSLTAS